MPTSPWPSPFPRRTQSQALALTTALLCGLPFTASAQTHAESVNINATANRRAIDPRIYGVAFANNAAQLNDLNTPLHRSGGNLTSRYNWLQNASNHDFDYFFESIADGNGVAGASADGFVQDSRTGAAQPMLTIPMIGWVAKLGSNRSILPSFSVAKYGAQCAVDPYLHDAGNGLKPNCSTPVTNNDPNDANVPADSTFQKAWVQHLVAAWGSAAAGGVKYYILDNEHSIWFSTHRDVHPVGPHATEIRDKMIDYSTMIKSVDAGAIVIGPEEYGWTGYIFSGYDQQWSAINGYNSIPDRTNVMGGNDYMPWLLGQLKASYVSTGKKPIDVFSLHYYPHDNEFSDAVDTATQIQRNTSTRALWDPNLFDNSYIQDYIKLIPRMRNWVDSNYIPGTPIAITEYNWGAENHINGATAQADIYGIFGREGLDMATRWTTPDSSTPTFKAMKMYRNYDGAKSTFGDTSVSASVANPDNLSAFSALRTSDGALTTMVISKYLSGTTSLTLNLANFNGSGVAQVYQLTSANVITRLADVNYGATLSLSVPGQSVTLFVMPAAISITGAYSRRTHGAAGPFDLPLLRDQAIDSAVTVEPRIIDATHTVVFRMSANVASIGAVTAVNPAGTSVGAPTATFSGTDIVVTLHGLDAIGDNQRLKVKVANINGLGVDAVVSLALLVGDVDSRHKVNACDISATKAHRNMVVTAANFRFDIDASGTIDQTDIDGVKARSGKLLQ